MLLRNRAVIGCSVVSKILFFKSLYYDLGYFSNFKQSKIHTVHTVSTEPSRHLYPSFTRERSYSESAVDESFKFMFN